MSCDNSGSQSLCCPMEWKKRCYLKWTRLGPRPHQRRLVCIYMPWWVRPQSCDNSNRQWFKTFPGVHFSCCSELVIRCDNSSWFFLLLWWVAPQSSNRQWYKTLPAAHLFSCCELVISCDNSNRQWFKFKQNLPWCPCQCSLIQLLWVNH